MTADQSREPRQSVLHVAVIVVLCVLTFVGSLDGGFVSDDVVLVRDNPRLSSLSLAKVGEIFRTFDGPNYTPVSVLSLAVDRYVWGPGGAGYHVTNVLLHTAWALLVYAILRRLGLAALAALLGAALWAVHPLQVESVAWMSERRNVLSGMFFFAAFLVYLDFSERPRARSYAAFVALHLLALLSKMNTMVLPAVCLAYEITFRHRLRRQDVLAALPPLALGVLVAWYNLTGNPIHGDVWYGGSRIVTWLSVAVVVFRYLGNVLLPFGLRPGYDVTLHGSALDPPVLASLLGLIALAGGTTLLVVRRRREAFGMLWFGITLAPMLNLLVPFRSLMNDRYMYLPLVGLVASLACALDGLRSAGARRMAGAAAALAVAACAVLSVRQVEIWSTPLTLWQSLADRPLPGADPVYRDPDYEGRVAYLREALIADPSSGAFHNNLGALYYSAGQMTEALVERDTAQTVTLHVLGADNTYDVAAKMPLAWLLETKPGDHNLG